MLGGGVHSRPPGAQCHSPDSHLVNKGTCSPAAAPSGMTAPEPPAPGVAPGIPQSSS